MIADQKREYFVRFYQTNPGGAYDPAHLPQFEMEGEAYPVIPLPGDIVSTWTKHGDNVKGDYEYFKVIDRCFRYDTNEVFVSVLVEAIASHWTHQFNN